MTYKEAYTEHLRNRLNTGGSPAEMEEAITEFNSVETPRWTGSTTFTKWAENHLFICDRCDRRYNLEPGNSVEIENAINCMECVKSVENGR